MEEDERHRRMMQAIRDVERDYEARAARERLIRDNPQIPYLEQIARNQADIRDELQRLGRR